MRALAFEGGRATVREVRRPAPRKGFALVRVVMPLVSAVFPLASAVRALREAGRPGVLKVLLRP